MNAALASISQETGQLDREVMAFVRRGHERADEERFNALALRHFELQYNAIRPFREYCRSRNLSPGTVARWNQIPAATSFSIRQMLRASSTGGNTQDTYPMDGIIELRNKRGRIYPDKGALEVTDAANELLAREFLFPDVGKMLIFFIIPPPHMAPGMVMARGSERLRERFGAPGSRFLISFLGLDLKALVDALRLAEKTGQPLALIGATFAFDYFLNACRKEGIKFSLPEGSRLCDSGGHPGRYVGCPREEFFAKCRDMLGLAEDSCVNAMWICESSTVYFDNVLKKPGSARFKKIPSWCRVSVVSPRGFGPVPKGEAGLLRLYDLTNRSMAFAVQTNKLGVEVEDGFEVMGKWDLNTGSLNIDHATMHPGGRAAMRLVDYLISRNLSRIGKTGPGTGN